MSYVFSEVIDKTKAIGIKTVNWYCIGENMIIVKLSGGLGNQMFQYAVGRSLAHKYNTELKLDIKSLKHDKLRNYSLNNFNILENFVTAKDLFRISPHSEGSVAKIFKRIMQNIPFLQYIEYVKEREFSFQKSVLSLPDNVYLDGYWQSERYFLDIENIIRKEFSIVSSLTSASQEIAEQIKDCESVSVHVRRGDYVSNPTISGVHGVCSLDYYCRSINMICDNINNPHFFVFSDDPEWACCNIKPDAPTVYVRRTESSKDYEDICLMSMCKYHIIANSSFSWWGAWLNKNSDKIVIAPKKWFNSETMDTQDLIPAKWYKL